MTVNYSAKIRLISTVRKLKTGKYFYGNIAGMDNCCTFAERIK